MNPIRSSTSLNTLQVGRTTVLLRDSVQIGRTLLRDCRVACHSDATVSLTGAGGDSEHARAGSAQVRGIGEAGVVRGRRPRLAAHRHTQVPRRLVSTTPSSDRRKVRKVQRLHLTQRHPKWPRSFGAGMRSGVDQDQRTRLSEPPQQLLRFGHQLIDDRRGGLTRLDAAYGLARPMRHRLDHAGRVPSRRHLLKATNRSRVVLRTKKDGTILELRAGQS